MNLIILESWNGELLGLEKVVGWSRLHDLTSLQVLESGKRRSRDGMTVFLGSCLDLGLSKWGGGVGCDEVGGDTLYITG